MENVTTIVTEIWDFLIPPLIKIVLVIAITVWVARPLFYRALDRIRTLVEKIKSEEKTKSFFKSIGIEKPVPGLSVFVLVLSIYAGNQLILGVGRVLPLDVLTIQPHTFLHHTSDEELRAFWSRYPNLKLDELWTALQNDILKAASSHTSDALEDIRLWEGVWDDNDRWFHTVKFLIFYVVVLWGISMRKKEKPRQATKRALVAIPLLCLVLAFLASRELYIEYQLHLSRYSILVTTAPDSSDLETVDARELNIQIERAKSAYGGDSWWRIETFDTYPWITGFKFLGGDSRFNRQQDRNKRIEDRIQAPKPEYPESTDKVELSDGENGRE